MTAKPIKKYNGAGLTQEQIDKDKAEFMPRLQKLVDEYLENIDDKIFWATKRAEETLQRQTMQEDIQDIKKNCADKTKDCCAVQIMANNAEKASKNAMGWIFNGILPLIVLLFSIVFYFAIKFEIIQM